VPELLRYRGRSIDTADVEFLRALVAEHSDASRRALSVAVCRAWDWKQANGALRDGVCRSLLVALERAGHIVLPPPHQVSPPRPRRRPSPVEVDTSPLEAPLRGIGPIELRQVRRTPEEVLVDGLIAEYHYLGFARPVGEHLKYLVTAGGRPIACFCWTSSARHLGPRDRHIGWSAEARRANVHLLAYQSRFLILPWVRVPHLASHLLGRMSARLSVDWLHQYAHPIYFTETFVDPGRYRGTCYRAANWTELGMTAGRGYNSPTKKPNRSLKQVWGYALVKDFRRRLSQVGS
jgi:hypothetical protein